MNSALAYLWRHPRRTGFIAFNAIVLLCFTLWGSFTAEMSREGVAGVPNLMLGYTGMAFLVLAWSAAWAAWLVLLVRRQARRRA